MKNRMLVASAFLLALVSLVHQMHATAPPPPYYAVTPAGCVSIPPVSCSTTVSNLCTVTIEGITYPVRTASTTSLPCAVPLYRN